MLCQAPPQVVIVDDCRGDVELLREGCRESGWRIELLHEPTVEDALDYVRSVADQRAPRPQALILDINMPSGTGFEVLREARHAEAWRDVPIFMFSSSLQPADVERADELGATGYIGKPADFGGYVEVAQCLRPWVPPGSDEM